MVIQAFPIAKLGALLVRQISKPLTNSFIIRAKSSPFFRKYVCLPPAMFYNWCEVKSKMWMLNMGKPVNIPVLNEESLIELGANLLGETILFVIAAVILISEYNRSSRKEAAKEEAKAEEMRNLKDTIRDLFMQCEEHRAQISELSRKLNNIETKSITKPWAPKNPSPITPPKDTPRKPPPILITDTVEENNTKKDDDLDKNINNLNIDNKITSNNYGLILTAVYDLEKELLFDPNKERHNGILTTAVSQFFKDFYKISLTF